MKFSPEEELQYQKFKASKKDEIFLARFERETSHKSFIDVAGYMFLCFLCACGMLILVKFLNQQ
jgi:hypothetical protein